ncbi:hypothetical protein P691DRAFT_776456 [Macrolepiota fuliginosa MF-IS2]|uniref:F-box domain-containing protein n=1 Tax=Macrolepiota fuliginosa MF-IS2 TaxID=1400762 RepID=A0A9P5X9L9_9AGAR|nr:hypothetical protein P691DRAFT_776456 [Macrolepiota fuliginosa MF-IS2]
MNQIPCPRCGNYPGEAAQHSGSEDEEVAIISQETRRIDVLIHVLYEERARLLRRLNAIRSPTKSLPHEVLADIFQRACSSDEESSSKRPQITLGSVSTHWRTVAQNPPQLWNNIELVLVRESVDSLAPLLQLYLDNTRSTPVVIKLDFCPDDCDMRTLKKRKDDESWLHNCAVSFQSIIKIDICFSLLTQCPNLVHFSSNSLTRSTAVVDYYTTAITLPHLRHFRWSSSFKGPTKWDQDVLRFLRFPELQHLAFPIWDSDEFISHFLDFLATLPATLGTLKLFFSSKFTASRLPPVFKCVPQITQLIFLNSVVTNLSDFFIHIQILSLLPLLRVFKYVHSGVALIAPPIVPSSFLQSMEERKGSGAKGFRFELVKLKVPWASSIQRSLQRLVEQAFELEIVEEGVPVGWLRN